MKNIQSTLIDWVSNNQHCKQIESCYGSLSKECVCPKEPTEIDDWLNEYGDPEIYKKVERKLELIELKQLGFDEPCFGLFTRDNTLLEKWIPNQTECESYFGGFLAPIYQQAFRWFREKHQLPSWVYTSNNQEYWYSVLKDGRMIVRDYKPFKSYEEAELACLRKLIEIVKQKQ